MIEAETALLEAVRDRLIKSLDMAGKCEIEFDDEAPAITADEYLTVQPGGITPGRHHVTSGTVWDLMFGVRVAVMMRIGNVPRDRRRQVFLDRLRGINRRLTQVTAAIDMVYAVTTDAQDRLPSIAGGGKFIKPLQFAAIDQRPRTVVQEPYAGYSQPAPGSTPLVAIVRGVTFGNCRFLRENAAGVAAES